MPIRIIQLRPMSAPTGVDAHAKRTTQVRSSQRRFVRWKHGSAQVQTRERLPARYGDDRHLLSRSRSANLSSSRSPHMPPLTGHWMSRPGRKELNRVAGGKSRRMRVIVIATRLHRASAYYAEMSAEEIVAPRSFSFSHAPTRGTILWIETWKAHQKNSNCGSCTMPEARSKIVVPPNK